MKFSNQQLQDESTSRADFYRYAVQPQLSNDGLSVDGKPIRKKKKLKKLQQENFEDIRLEMNMVLHSCFTTY